MWIYTATSHLYASFTEVILRGAVNWNNWTSFKTREAIMDCSIMRNMSWASSLTSRSSMMNAQSFILPLLPVRCVHTWDGFLLHTWWLTWWVSCGFESLARCQVPCMLLRLLCCAPHTHTHTWLYWSDHTRGAEDWISGLGDWGGCAWWGMSEYSLSCGQLEAPENVGIFFSEVHAAFCAWLKACNTYNSGRVDQFCSSYVS